jgi:predicted amidohydrolase
VALARNRNRKRYEVKISIGQVTATIDKLENIRGIESATREASAAGAGLVVFPEVSMFKQVVTDSDLVKAGEPLNGPFVTALRRIAIDNNISIIAGMSESIPDEERVYNTIVVVSSTGSLLGSYRKVHLYDAFGATESDLVRPGEMDQKFVFEIDGFKFGIMTCYDVRFPETARNLMDRGADVLVIPTAWAPGVLKEMQWETLVRARAIENTVYVVAVDIAPPDCPGDSMIVDPMGVIIARAPETVAVITADVSKERTAKVREKNPSLANRRFKVLPA